MDMASQAWVCPHHQESIHKITICPHHNINQFGMAIAGAIVHFNQPIHTNSMNFSEYRLMVLLESELDQIDEMARVGPQNHGISDVVIFVGETNKRHGLRVKVSKHKNKWITGQEHNFIIQMPSLDYDSKDVPKWINGKIMKQILGWIKLNQQSLIDFEEGKIIYTDDFLRSLSKYPTQL
jgi:hypothetical protein